MRIKVISNGKPAGTRIVNADTGEEIENVIACDLFITHKGVEATMRLFRVEVDVETAVGKSPEDFYETALAPERMVG